MLTHTTKSSATSSSKKHPSSIFKGLKVKEVEEPGIVADELSYVDFGGDRGLEMQELSKPKLVSPPEATNKPKEMTDTNNPNDEVFPNPEMDTNALLSKSTSVWTDESFLSKKTVSEPIIHGLSTVTTILPTDKTISPPSLTDVKTPGEMGGFLCKMKMVLWRLLFKILTLTLRLSG